MFPYSFFRNSASVSIAETKLNRNELKLEDVLDEDDLVSDVKTNPQSLLANFFTSEIIRKLIDYATKMPKDDDLKIGHKYPFNACEILCSENAFILDKILENTKLADEDDDSDDSNIFKGRGKKLSEDSSSRKNSDNKKDDLDNYSIENSEDSKKIANDQKIDNCVEDKMEIDSIEKNKKTKDDFSNKIKKEMENIQKIIENSENENNNKEIHEKNLLEKNNEDELNFVKEAEEISENQNEKKNTKEKTEEIKMNIDEDSNPSKKKVLFVEDETELNARFENSESSQRVSKKGFHQKKNNIDSLNVNMEKLIIENNQTELEESDEKENVQEKLKENDRLNLSDDLCKSYDCSLNESLKSENCQFLYPNLDILFEFLTEEDNLNYVLSGYFSKIFNHLLNTKSPNLVKYCYRYNFDIFDKLICNLQRRSICDCLQKLLTIHVDLKVVPNALQLKIQIVEKIFHQMADFDTEALLNTSEMIVECLKNKNFYLLFISESNIFKTISELLSRKFETENNSDKIRGHKEEIFKCVIKIMNKLNENILKDFGSLIVTPSTNDDTDSTIFNFQSINIDAGINSGIDEDLLTKKVEPEEIKSKLDRNYNLLCEISYKFIQELIDFDKNEKNNRTIQTTFDKDIRIMGTMRLLSVEYLKNIIDITINSFALSYNSRISKHIEKIIEMNPFNILIDYYFEFEFNNVYQKLFEHLIILLVNSHTPSNIVKLFFEDCDFLGKFINYTINNYTFKYNSGKVINSGNLASGAEIISVIMKSENEYLKSILEKNDKIKKLFQFYYDPISSNYFKNLLYNNKPGKTTYFDRINNFEETEFDLETPVINEVQIKNLSSIKSFIISCRDEYLNGKNPSTILRSGTEDLRNSDIDDNMNPLEFVSKGNLDHAIEFNDAFNKRKMSNEEKSEEIFLFENKPENSSPDDRLFEVRRNGFNKNNEFNTDQEINFTDENSEFSLRTSLKFVKKELKDTKDENDFNDLKFWDNKITTPEDLDFLNDL